MFIVIIFAMITILTFSCTSHIHENITNKNKVDKKGDVMTVQMLKDEFNETLEFEKKTDKLISKWNTD